MDGSGRKMGGLDSRCIVSFLAPQYYLPQHSAYSNDDEVDDRIAAPPNHVLLSCIPLRRPLVLSPPCSSASVGSRLFTPFVKRRP